LHFKPQLEISSYSNSFSEYNDANVLHTSLSSLANIWNPLEEKYKRNSIDFPCGFGQVGLDKNLDFSFGLSD